MAVLQTTEKFDESTGEIFPHAPKGVYEARITGVKDVVTGDNSKHPGSPMWIIDACLLDPDQETVRVSWFQTLPEGDGTEWMDDAEKTKRWNEIKRLWNAVGLDGSGGQIDSDDLINCELRLDLGVEEYPKDSGKMKNSVKDILAI